MAKELEKETESLMKYMRFSRLLFGGSKNTPQLINELKPGSEFYGLAKKTCEEDGISWEKMNDDESNYIIMIMLNELYLEIGKSTRKLKMVVCEKEDEDGNDK